MKIFSFEFFNNSKGKSSSEFLRMIERWAVGWIWSPLVEVIRLLARWHNLPMQEWASPYSMFSSIVAING